MFGRELVFLLKAEFVHVMNNEAKKRNKNARRLHRGKGTIMKTAIRQLFVMQILRNVEIECLAVLYIDRYT